MPVLKAPYEYAISTVTHLFKLNLIRWHYFNCRTSLLYLLTKFNCKFFVWFFRENFQNYFTMFFQRKITEPFYFVSRGTAEVLSMPYPNLDITPGTLLRHIYEVSEV